MHLKNIQTIKPTPDTENVVRMVCTSAFRAAAVLNHIITMYYYFVSLIRFPVIQQSDYTV